MPDMVVQKDKQYSWIRYINQRIRKNKNFLCFISGPTGSGKSYSSLRIAEIIDTEFSEERIVFSGLELMQLINSGSLKKGSVVVFEEAGIGISNKNWQSTTNKMLNFLIQTFRHRNFILIFNSPYMDFVDASTRRLFHAELRTINIDFKEKKVKLKPQLIQYNSRLQKFYYKYLRVVTKRGVIPVSSWKVEKPSSELVDRYEIKKREFTSKLNKKIMSEMEEQEAGGKQKELTTIQSEIVEAFKKGYSVEAIAEERGCNSSLVRRQRQFIEKKGYKINPIKDGAKVLYYEVIEP
jgi:hypothetical protein